MTLLMLHCWSRSSFFSKFLIKIPKGSLIRLIHHPKEDVSPSKSRLFEWQGSVILTMRSVAFAASVTMMHMNSFAVSSITGALIARAHAPMESGILCNTLVSSNVGTVLSHRIASPFSSLPPSSSRTLHLSSFAGA